MSDMLGTCKDTNGKRQVVGGLCPIIHNNNQPGDRSGTRRDNACLKGLKIIAKLSLVTRGLTFLMDLSHSRNSVSFICAKRVLISISFGYSWIQ